MREPETQGGSQRECNVVEEMNWTGVASAGRGIPHGCLYQKMTDQTVRRRSWERKEVVGKASALGHCLGCEDGSEY